MEPEVADDTGELSPQKRAKTNAQCSKEYKDRRRHDDPEYKERERKRIAAFRAARKQAATEEEKQQARKKETDRKREYRRKKQAMQQTPGDTWSNQGHVPYQRHQSLGKAVSKVIRHLPYSPRKQVDVMTGVAERIGIQPETKMSKQISGPRSLSSETAEAVKNFYTYSSIVYTMPDFLPPQLFVCEEEVPPEQQERSPSLGQEEPEPLQIKEEQEELWTSQEGEQLQGLEEADIIKFTFNPFYVKCEHDGENTESSQFSQTMDPELLQIKKKQEELFQDLEEADGFKVTLHHVKYENDGENTLSSQLNQTHDPELLQIKDELLQVLEEADGSKNRVHPVKCEDGQENVPPFQPLQTQGEKNIEAYSLPSTSTEQMKTEPDGEDCGVSEPARSLDPADDLEPTRDNQLLSSDCSGTETDDSDEWEETGEPQSGLNTLKSKKTQKNKGQSLSNSNKFKSSVGSSHEVKLSDQILSETLSCKVCGKCCPNRCSFMVHVRVHSSDCGLCGKHLEPTESLKLHLETHRTCTVCGKKCTTATHLDYHMRSHTGEKPYSCTLCHKRFGHKGNLKVHLSSHSEEKPFSCTLCNKRYGLKGNLRVHLRSHTKEKPSSCTLCHKRFDQKAELDKHMRSHTGGKPFSCMLCNNRFVQKAEFENHMRNHTGEKPYGCTLCNKRFALEQSLKEHLNSHTEEKPTKKPHLWYGYLNC